jgi:hypothetical protein
VQCRSRQEFNATFWLDLSLEQIGASVENLLMNGEKAVDGSK